MERGEYGYDVIYADPPWCYKTKNTGGSFKSGASFKYPTMSKEEIASMPIKGMMKANAVCFLWVPVPLLPEGLYVMDSWGFTYKTMLTWKKEGSLGLGYWFRGQTEQLLVGIKGKFKPFRMQVPNHYSGKKGRHSEKPHYFRELISTSVIRSVENPRKLELFARSRPGANLGLEFNGWDVFGNEVTNSIKLPKVSKI